MYIDGLITLDAAAKGFSDQEGDEFKFALADSPPPPVWLIVDRNTGIMRATMLSGYQGTYTVKVTATDECGGSCGDVGTQLFTLEVPNRAPSQFTLPDPETIQLGSTDRFEYVISNAGTDVDGGSYYLVGSDGR